MVTVHDSHSHSIGDRGRPDADLALKKGPKVDVRATQFTQQIKRTPLLVYYKTARKKIFWANLLIY